MLYGWNLKEKLTTTRCIVHTLRDTHHTQTVVRHTKPTNQSSMKIKKIRIKNFRGYENETTIEFGNLTVFVGRNDVGKSSILEALDIFFNENKGTIKLDKDDINKKC